MFLPTGSDWPHSPQATLAWRILPAYVEHGPSRFASNADVTIRLWRAADQILPLVYREVIHTDRTTDVCSPWNHYVRYPLGEIDRHGAGISATFGRALLRTSSVFLRASRIDEVVSVNNWLLSTNPAVRLDEEELERLTAALRADFPRRAIVIRSINPTLHPGLVPCLTRRGYGLVPSRTVYLLDPSSRVYQQSENVRRDRRLLDRGDYELIGHEQLTNADMPRLAELHRLLYIEKHTALNTEFTPFFFETAWHNRLFDFYALRRDGRIDAYASCYELDGVVTGSLVGYDTRLPQKLGLYRRAVALLSEHARRRGLRLNLSAGAGAFKHHRGGEPSVEYDAVFDRHLPRYRRSGWRLLEAAGHFQHRKVRRGW